MNDFAIISDPLPIKKIQKNTNLKVTKLGNNFSAISDKETDFMYCKDSNSFIFFKGTIVNKEEIALLYKLKETSSLSIISTLYKKNKKDFFKDFNGNFSIVIVKNNREVFALTDHVGISPIFYGKKDQINFFSTSLRLLKSIWTNLEIDEDILRDYLVQSYPRLGRTIYRDINVLKGGYSLKHSENNTKIDRYFDITKIKKKSHLSFEDAVKNTRDIFFKVIENNLINTKGVVSFSLSGGIDSSSTVCTAKKIIKDLKTYSANFSEDDELYKHADEGNYIDSVVKHVSSKHKKFYFSDYDYFEHVDFASSFEEPIFGSAIYINRKILHNACLDGSRFHFEGAFGDEVISHGYEYLMELGHELNFQELFKQEKMLRANRGMPFSYTQSIKNYCLKSFIPAGIQQFFIKKNISPLENIIKKKYRFSFAKHFEKINGYHPYLKDNSINKNLHSRILAESVLPYGARLYKLLGERFNIEVMLPFLDKRLMKHCVSIPSRYKLNKGIDRYYFRESQKGIVPSMNLERETKADLSPLFIDTLKNQPSNKLIDVILKKNSYIANIICKSSLESLIKEFKIKGDWRIGSTLNRLIILSTWLGRNA